jgi:SAM-dependent methyltransferase
LQVIEHVPSLGATLRQLVSQLRPGGRLIIAVPNEDSLLGELNYHFLNLPPHHRSCWTQAALSYVAKLLSLSLEDYRREPFEIDLYVAALYQRMDKYLPARHFLMRPWLWLIRRAAIAMALTSFESIRAGSFGHAHIAVFRKSSE